jgi:capsular exopolysaccharide synthesis family protein
MTDEHRMTTVLWQGRRLVAVTVAVTVGLAILLTITASKVYEASAVFQVSVPNAPPGDATDVGNQSLARNYATLVVSPGFLEEASAEIVDGELSADDLAARLTADPIAETSLMELRARGDAPEDAEQLADEVASAFLTTLRRTATERSAGQQEEISAAIADIDAQIENLDVSDRQQAATLRDVRTALQRQSVRIVANAVALGSSATLAAEPTANPAAVSPRPLLNVLAGGILGLALGVGLVLLRERVSAPVLSGEDASAAVGLPVLASIPLQRKPSIDDPVLREAYEMLHATLGFKARGQDLAVLTISSNGADEGKTSVVEGLGRVAARAGASVLLIDGDMRLGTLSQRLGQLQANGLAELLAGAVDLDEATTTVEPRLSLLPAGTRATDAAGALQGARMRTLIGQLREEHDLVLIDSPPLGHLADGAILASLSDGLLMVARAGVTKLSALRGGVRSTKQSGIVPVGLVVFEPRSIDRSYYRALAGGRANARQAGSSSHA